MAGAGRTSIVRGGESAVRGADGSTNGATFPAGTGANRRMTSPARAGKHNPPKISAVIVSRRSCIPIPKRPIPAAIINGTRGPGRCLAPLQPSGPNLLKTGGPVL